MKKKAIIKYILPLVAVMLIATAWFGTRQAAGAVQKLEEIEAYYVGSAVEVGKEINIKDIYISAKYYVSDGKSGYYDYEDVKKGFTVTPSVIKNKGDNQVVVSYKDKTCILTVQGKVVESITADYKGEDLYIGSVIPAGKVEVYAYFSDGSFEKVRKFTFTESKVGKAGLNTVTVVYEGKTAEIFVNGKEPLAVEEIMAYYIGKPVIAGNDISKNDIEVQALYNDGTMKRIENFNISPSIAEQEGENDITVTYGNMETVIQVYAEARYVTEMRARYIGPGVIVGKKVPKEEIEVVVTYNDGTDEAIDTYEMYGDEILFEGENMVLVYCDAFMEEIIVPGVIGFAANYDNAVSNGDGTHNIPCVCGVGIKRDCVIWSTFPSGGATHQGNCEYCGVEFSEPHHSYETVDNGDGTHSGTCVCGAYFTEGHQYYEPELHNDGQTPYLYNACLSCDYAYEEEDLSAIEGMEMLRMTTAHNAAGGTVQVSLETVNCPNGFNVEGIAVYYDKDILTLTDVEENGFRSITPEENMIKGATVLSSRYDRTVISPDNILFTLTFEIAEGAAIDTVPITFEAMTGPATTVVPNA